VEEERDVVDAVGAESLLEEPGALELLAIVGIGL